MSYCVNCGVELDRTCRSCPLCQTPVYNPNEPAVASGPTPFPLKKGVEEPVKRYEYTVLITIVLAVTALVCRFTNLVIFPGGNWSFYIAGGCAVLWIFLLPFFFPNKMNVSLTLFLDGLSIAIFLWRISCLHPGNGWFVHIALPITAVTTFFIIILYVFTLRGQTSFIIRAATLIGNISLLCAAIELLVDSHYENPLSLSWSAVVLACGVMIVAALITISLLKGVREELRRRMHF